MNAFSIKFSKNLSTLYTQEGFSLLGGFAHESNLHLLFFKLDNKGMEAPNIFAETWSP